MSAEPTPPSAVDPLDGLLDSVAEGWEHAASIVGKVLSGSYGAVDVFKDLVQCSAKANVIGLTALMGWADMLAPKTGKAAPNPNKASTTVGVHRTMATRPLHLQKSRFRGIGFGNRYWIDVDDVIIEPNVLSAETDDTFTVTLKFDNVSADERSRTIIYEGEINDPTGQAVTDTIRIAKPAQ